MVPLTPQRDNLQSSTETVRPKKDAMSVASLLMSPPDQTPYECFSQGSAQVPTQMVKFHGKTAQQAPSPPASPWTPSTSKQVSTTQKPGNDAVDPILFPDAAPAGPVRPLFPEPLVRDGAIAEHISARCAQPLPFGIRTPSGPEYAHFADYINIQWNSVYMELKTDEERRAYVRKERAQLKADGEARKQYLASLEKGPGKRPSTSFRQAPRKKSKPLLAAKPVAAAAARPSSSTGRPVSHVVASATGPRNVVKVTNPVTSRAGRTSRAASTFDSSASEPMPVRTVKKLTKPKTGKPQFSDRSFDRIPDYCPPISTLDGPDGRTMTYAPTPADQKPRPFNEEDKKLLHLLHPQEQELAYREALGVANYLTAKRRIFVDRLLFYHYEKEQQAKLDQQGKKGTFVKNFLKTHAQDAGKMDVNKASRMHTAFDSVGWLDRKWCERFAKPTFDNKTDRYLTAEDFEKGLLAEPQKIIDLMRRTGN
ncbi:unnamed protein product [Discula destructiva]